MLGRILIIDDNPIDLRLEAELLELRGYKVDVASDAEQAQSILSGVLPDLIVTDIALPGMDGLTALKKIREIDAAARVIICSALGQQQLIVQAIQLGAKDFIVKPFQPRRVIAALKKALDIT